MNQFKPNREDTDKSVSANHEEYERKFRYKQKPDYLLGFWFSVWKLIYEVCFCDAEEYYIKKKELSKGK